jgi:amino acid transporter
MSAGSFPSSLHSPRSSCCWWRGALRAWPITIPMRARPMGSWAQSSARALAWSRAGRCSGPTSALPSSVSAPSASSAPICCSGFPCGRSPSSFVLTGIAALIIAPLSVIPTRRAGLVLILLEGVAVVAMLVLACAVIVRVLQGHGPQGDPPLRDLFIPAAGVGAASIAMGLSFGLLSFAGFEQVATLGEEVEKSRFTIPRVLIGTVLGAGVVFTLVTAAQTLGFGTDPAGVSRFTHSTSLLADLSATYFGGRSGDLFDALAIASALGGALASIVASARILFALSRDLAPSSALARISEASGTPHNAAVCVVVAAIAGYAAMRVAFHASASDAFFWGSTLGALALLIVYLLVAVSAAGALIRWPKEGARWMLLIPALAVLAIAYTLWINIRSPDPGAYQMIPWIVLLWCCAPLLATLLHPRLVDLITSGFLAATSREK